MLQAENLSCQRGEQILFSNLNLHAGPGDLIWLAGTNGSGKTSLLRILCGLSGPLTGNVRWKQRPVSEPAFRAELCYLGHATAIKDELSALENLRIALELGNQGLSEEAARDALARIGLGGREELPAKVLSQGQKRRVAIARLLVTDVPLWILDEPLTALDSTAVESIQARIAEHLARAGIVIYTSHQALAVPGAAPRRVALS